MEERDAHVLSEVLVNGNGLKRRGWGVQGHFALLYVGVDDVIWVFSLNNIRLPVVSKLHMLNFEVVRSRQQCTHLGAPVMYPSWA